MQRSSRTLVFVGLLFIALLGGGVYVDQLNQAHYESERRLLIQEQLFSVRSDLEHRLLNDFQLIRGLISAVAIDPNFNHPTFSKATDVLFQNNQHILGVSAAPDNVIKFVYPAGEANRITLSTDNLASESEKRAGVVKDIVLAGPIYLPQGGQALIIRAPVYLLNTKNESHFWGLLNLLIDIDELMLSSGIDDSLPVEIAIKGLDITGAKSDAVWGRNELFDENPVTADLNFPLNQWTLAAIAGDGLIDPHSYLWPLRWGYLFAALLVLTAFFMLLVSLRTAHLAQRKAEKSQLELTELVDKLNAREHLLHTVIDEIPDVLVLKDEDGKFILGNVAVAKLYGTTPEEMVGKDDSDFGVPKEQADFFRQNIMDIIQSGETEIVFEDSTDAITGERRRFKSIKKPFKGEKGRHQILVIAQDITDIIAVQEQLSESEGKLRTILDNVAACIYLKDPSGKYLFANSPVRELWGVEMDEIVGFGDEKFFDAETVERIRINDAEVFTLGKTFKAEEVNTVEGSSEAVTYHSTKLPIRHEDGSIYALCGISIDISDTKRIENALRESERRFKMAGMAACDLIYEWDVASDTLTWFGDVDKMLGFGPGEISHHIDAWLKLVHPDDMRILEEALALHRTSTQAINYEYKIAHSSGSYLTWSDHALPLVGDDGLPYKWIGVCTDITVQKRHHSQLEYNAYHDTLTNLPNRSLLSDRLRQAIHQEKRRGQQLMVVYIDLDGFKEVNDNHGHEVGDHLLVAIGSRLQELLREGDTIARLGGDEFVAVLMDIGDFSEAVPLLRRVLQAASQPILVDDLTLQVTASLGVASYPQADEVDADQLIRQADQAMYQAKLAGKNRYYFFDAEQDRSLRGRRDLLKRTELALERHEFELYYQPKVNMRTGDVIGAEALIRWNHPEEGLLPPNAFLPIIEDQPFAILLGEWVIETAVSQIDAWQQKGVNLVVSVNIGGLQLQQDNFVERLQGILARHPDVRPQSLELEVLESSALQDIVKVSAVMRDCHKLGVSFALDDFGTGYSSLVYLKNLPAEVLKIDQSFVRDMLDDPDDLAILEGIMGMASAFRRQVIAEGVEGEEHGLMLIQLGCELAQGYAIAYPMPAKKIPVWTAEWTPPHSWQQQVRIEPENLTLLFSMIEHRAWVKALDDYLTGTSTMLPEFSVTKCRFGLWLGGEGAERFGGSPFYDDIVRLHKAVHDQAEHIFYLFSEERTDEVLEAQQKLHQVSGQLLKNMGSLLNQKSKWLAYGFSQNASYQD